MDAVALLQQKLREVGSILHRCRAGVGMATSHKRACPVMPVINAVLPEKPEATHKLTRHQMSKDEL